MMKITDIKINGMEHPMGYVFSHVTVSWRVEDTDAVHQSSSRVTIAQNAQMEHIIAEQRGVLPCAGITFDISLKPRTAYYVRVEVTGDNGEQAVGDIVSFETGKMEEPWLGSWIGMQEDDCFHPVFEKTFALKEKPVRGRLYITGVGLYEACLNDKKIGDDVLAPFFNDYNCAIQCQTYDVTEQLKDSNTLSVLLGNGWYKGRLGFGGAGAVYGDRFACIAELHIEYAGGSEDIIATDDSWQYYPSDITYSDIYDGEGIDRCKNAAGITKKQAAAIDMSDKKLADRYSLPLKEMEELEPVEILHTPAGETVLDFGQNFAGYVCFHAAFPSGTKVVLTHGELLQNDNFYHDNYRSAKTEFTYISDGREEWVKPHFTYTGFRYVKVEGWPGEPQLQDFIGVVVYSAMERTGWIETGHEKVNRLFSNALWGLKSNFLDMPTDCPQRDERLGWTGDAQVFAPTASFFMDTKAFYCKFLWDMRCDQVLHDGAAAAYLPNFDGAPVGASAWADAAAFIPITVYEAFGDKGLLSDNYPLMRDWVEWMRRNDEQRPGGAKYLFNRNFTFGDWLAMDGVTEQSMKGGTEDGYIGSVYFYASTCKLAQAAKALGYSEDYEKYTTLAEKIREAVLEEYFAPSGRLCINTQAGYIIALKFGIYRSKEVLCAGLRSRLKNDGYRIRCGFVGAPLMCETLAENGMADIALHMFLQEKFPSWLHCVNLGATTIWERWNSVLEDGSISGTGMNSLNHYAYGSVVNYAVRYLAGFRHQEPGYSRVLIAPQIDARLGHMNCTYKSASGRYVANWSIEQDGSVKVHVEVPFDCTAKLVLPEYKELELEAGVTDITYRPERDFRCIYNWNSLLDDCAEDPRAMELMRELLPGVHDMAASGDLENLGLSFMELKNMPWFGFRPEEIDRLTEKLFALKAEIFPEG